ncbi:MAG TPA: phosphate acyltransferase, partial [Massilibacterium sp.]|nr:phosphate acyltransferase [Massilibacterium sp.]
MNDLFASVKEKVVKAYPTIVFPEGTDERILEAAGRLSTEGVLKPVLLGDEKEIQALIEEKGLSFKDVEIINPKSYDKMDEMIEAFFERRKGKETKEEAATILLNENYFGTMLTYMGKVNGLVSGAVHSTGDTVRPALQIIKTK